MFLDIIAEYLSADDWYDPGNTHVVQPVSVCRLRIVEPGTVTSLPLLGAEHAELGHTSTSQVVTAFLQLDHGFAVEAPLPAFFLCNVEQFLRVFVFWAFAPLVPFGVAFGTYFGLAFRAQAVLAALVRMDLVRPYPRPTPRGRAVKPVLGGVFFILFVPEDFELGVEEAVDIFQRYVLSGTTTWRHVRSILYRHGEDTFQAGVTHPVATC